MTSFTASRVFSWSIDATKAHDMTLAGGASFNGGIFLAAVAVDSAWKGPLAGRELTRALEEK
jgi:hypothetical protein